MIDFVVDVISLSLAIFVGSALFDWWRKKDL